MHLAWSESSYKGRKYRSYRIVESYRDKNGQSRKKTLFPLGPLSPEQVEKIQMILSVTNDPSTVVCRLRDVIPIAALDYLDIAVAKSLWEEHNLSAAFSQAGTDSDIPTGLVAEVLTINRCVAPRSHYAIKRWLAGTALPQMLGVAAERFNEDKLYYELDKIAQTKEQIENHLLSLLRRHDPESLSFLNYDLTTSYFVGVRCPLSKFGHSKDGRPGNKQVLLGLLVNRDGFPFHWDVWPGNTAETATLRSIVETCRCRFRVRTPTLVFDRGLVSEENLRAIEEEGFRYITALDRDQIRSVPGVPWDAFESLSIEKVEKENWRLDAFERYDDHLWFRDLGVVDGRRYVLGFNPCLFVDQRKARQERIDLFEKFLRELNENLARAKRTRQAQPAIQKARDKLRRLKLSRFFHPPKAEERFTQGYTSRPKKQPSSVRTWRIVAEPDEDKLRADERLDGLCVLVTNHVERRPDGGFRVTAREIVEAYRSKSQIEDAFKHVKSFLKIRPFYVNTDAHVRAVYTICVLAYFINRTLAERRHRIEGKDFINSDELYAPFTQCKLTRFTAPGAAQTVTKPVKLTAAQKRLLSALDLSHLERPMLTNAT